MSMKLSDYAKQHGVRYETAWRWFRDGKIQGRRVGAHTILIDEPARTASPVQATTVVSTRVSSAENKANLDTQAERLVAYCAARGYQVRKVVKEIGSGVNDNRPKFLALLADPKVGRIVIERKDRGTRFGFRYIETLLHTYGREIEVVNQAEHGTEDLLSDLTSIVYSFCARLYGQRRAKRQTERLVQELEADRAPG
ncbi:IS607 family transposase [Ktedonospora formicarum]|uniref:Resolvase n=1 Tax=Ktedonospora formicarum TaxID=2778364 RepID=A0A8J3MWN3_9CHLR|nr:IS607 family transposase [Ktedonospora formicarum]GHO48838.1 resolvase [Ktedonospora formicarum]